MWSLAFPLALLLLPLPLLAMHLLPPVREPVAALVVPSPLASRLEAIPPSRLTTVGRWLLPILLWIGLVGALAGPRLIVANAALPASGRDLVLVLDFSGSMERKDFQIDGKPARRVDAVKQVAADFVRRRAGDRIGLVIFGDKAYFAAAPTFDVEAVARVVEESTIGISGRSTAISDGLGLALKRLRASVSPSRVVILLSDGVDNAGTVVPTDAASLARKLGVKVHTIALGQNDAADATDDRDAVDVAGLRAIANESGGTAFRVRSMADLEAVGEAIDALEPGVSATAAREIHQDLWIWPAGLAFLAALTMVCVPRLRP
ncbi:MAG: VWA domain-containing protein [Parvibaculaceae bacterium]